MTWSQNRLKLAVLELVTEHSPHGIDFDGIVVRLAEKEQNVDRSEVNTTVNELLETDQIFLAGYGDGVGDQFSFGGDRFSL